jgi:V8-like Glu-specific endopeptidase
VSWQRGSKVGAAALGVFAAISVASATVGVHEASGTTQIADATGTGVTYQVSVAAQGGALSYWTARRMLAVMDPQAPELTTAPRGTPWAVRFTGSPTTGALFYTTGGKAHFCTASVVNSAQGDLLLTAAHCVYGKSFATDVEYVPQYHDGKQPYGAWPVRSITVASGWQQSHNVNLDFAFLAVAPQKGKSVQATTGGLMLGTNLPDDEKIVVIGHNDTDDEPVRCATKSFRFRFGQLGFYCHGFWTGTSGGPWIIGYNARTGGGTVFGVIGGYEQGGDYEWASYSAYFGSSARTLYQQAESQPVPSPPSGSLENPGAVHLAQRVGQQLQADTIRVLEVEGRAACLGIRNADHVQLALQVGPLLLRHRDGDVVDVAKRLQVRAEVEPGEVEERQQVAVADVEEEVR